MQSLRATTLVGGVVSRTPGAGIVVADNGSTDDSVRFLERRYPQVELLRLDRNYGYAEGYNRALAGLNAEYFVLLNSDVEVTEGWLDPLIRTLDGDGSVAAVSPKIRSFGEPDKFEYAGAAGIKERGAARIVLKNLTR